MPPKAAARSCSAPAAAAGIRKRASLRALHAGDVVVIPANVKHWHGAAKDSWFAHLSVEVPGEETSNEWLEPVDDQSYNAL